MKHYQKLLFVPAVGILIFTGNYLNLRNVNRFTRFTKDGSSKHSLKRNTVVDDHPNKGARHPDGVSFGYIAKTNLVRDNFWNIYHQESGRRLWKPKSEPPMQFLPFSNQTELNVVCNTNLTEGIEGPGGWKVLQHILVNSSNPTNGSAVVDDDHVISSGRILCVTITHEGAHHRLPGIRESWAWRCDGYFAASTRTIVDPHDQGFGAVDIPHAFNETYGNLWNKLRSILSYVYRNHESEFDYFYVVNDDAPVIVENMRRYLGLLEKQGWNSSKPFLTGQLVAGRRYTGGGSGHLMNRAALFQAVAVAKSGVCRSDQQTSADDRLLGVCMRNEGVKLVDSVDETGRSRFHGRSPAQIYNENSPNRNKIPYAYIWESQQHGRKFLDDVISSQSVALHGIKSTIDMKRVTAILYRSCPKETALAKALKVWDTRLTLE